MNQQDEKTQSVTENEEKNQGMLAFSELVSDYAEKMLLVDQQKASCPLEAMRFYPYS
ncbi:MAG: hypothetical protein FWH40_03665 [Coriobacteriia bacterium]|nr:hypothetical protein [Coriobacteriia bacterium]